MRRAAGLVSLFCALTLSPPIEASGLRVSPLRLDVGGQQPAAELLLQNLTDAPLPVEITTVKWQQINGQDEYTETDDLFFAPPIIRIAPGASQSVRFLLTTEPEKTTEGSYRVYVEELPAADAGKRSSAMSFRMRFGVPLFVAAQQPAPPELEMLSAERSGKQLRLKMRNSGHTHLRVNQLLVLPDSSAPGEDVSNAIAQAQRSTTGSNYLLPGATQEWHIDLGQQQAGSVLLATDYYGNTDQASYQGDGRYWFSLP